MLKIPSKFKISFVILLQLFKPFLVLLSIYINQCPYIYIEDLDINGTNEVRVILQKNRNQKYKVNFFHLKHENLPNISELD